ncbi:MAG: hypothetical protein J0L75_15080 [Spirochaetes bacterium]|nr:hypothetical protein [Spirochaetota bacterium]
MRRLVRVLSIIALAAIPLAAADRISFEDGTVLTVTILDQTDETFTYRDEKGETNTVYKSELKGVEFKIGDDKFFQAAMEEADPMRQILLLEKSIARFPKDRANHIYLARCYLREMQLGKANELLTNRALENPGFDLLRVLYQLKATNSALALRTLDRLSRRRWNDEQRMHSAILESFATADQGRLHEALASLNGAEGRYGLALWAAYSNLQTHFDYPHYRKTLHSLEYLLKTREYRSAAQKEKLRPNLTRYWRRESALPAGARMVESIVIRERPARENLRIALAVVGASLVGAGAAFTAEWLDQNQDYLAARAWYEGATQPWELQSSSSPSSNYTGGQSDLFRNESLQKLAFLSPMNAYNYSEAWATYLMRFAYATPNLLLFGSLFEYLALADPGRLMEKARRARPPMHLRFETDTAVPNGLKLGCGLTSIALLGASAVFAAEAATLWAPIAASRYQAYTNNTVPEWMDFYYLGAQRAQNRLEAYRGLAISTAAAALLTGALYFIDPWKNKPTTSMILPILRPDGVGIQWVALR